MQARFQDLLGPVALVLCATGCTPDPGRAERRLHEADEIVFLTRNGPTTCYEDRDGLNGFECALAQELAERLHVEPRFTVFDTAKEVLDALERGEGDVAAAGFEQNDALRQRFLLGPPYHEIRREVVCRRGSPLPHDAADLTTRSILVIAGTPAEQDLVRLGVEHPGLRWSTTSELSDEQVFEKVWTREVDCTVTDSHVVALNRHYYPELVVAFQLGPPQELVWAVGPDDHDLRALLGDRFYELEKSNELQALRDRFFGQSAQFDYVDTRVFLNRIQDRLPKYRGLFVAAAEQHGFDWMLLAAQAYQESHWDLEAESMTGVRGIMMLTLPTAAELGVSERVDPVQSIEGGAKYLAKILQRIPKEIEGEDRMWFALAAYNVGLGHVLDAQELTRRRKRDPNVWHEVRRSLPLLSQPRFYRTLAHGYARGFEPVRYVRRIRYYHAVLRRQIEGS